MQNYPYLMLKNKASNHSKGKKNILGLAKFIPNSIGKVLRKKVNKNNPGKII
jgi:hypothetical protein